MSVAITSGVNYSLKPTSVKASRRTLVIPSSNKTTFDPGDTVVFYLPSLRSQVMDGASGYLRMTVEITGNGFLDNTAHSLIDRIMTYGPGGQLISDIQNYGVLANMLTDLQLSQSEKIGLSGVLGTEDDYGSTTATTALTASGVLAENYFATYPGAGGLAAGAAFAPVNATTTTTLTNSNRKGRALANGSSYTFCIPILHPLFSMSEKMWPSFACSDDVRVEITFATATNALVASTDFAVSNPEIIVDFIEFDGSVMPLIQQTYAGRDLIIPSQDYRHYASQITSTGSISQIIPCKQQSSRAFFLKFRPAETQAAAGYSLSSGVNPFYDVGDYFNLNIGGQKLPQHPITTRVAGEFSEWFASTQTALHAFNSLEMDGSLNRSYYNSTSAQAGHLAGADSYRNGFCLGINLDSLRGQNQTTNSGINLSGLTTYYEGYLANHAKTTGGADENLSVNAFLLFDVMFVVDQTGAVSVRF